MFAATVNANFVPVEDLAFDNAGDLLVGGNGVTVFSGPSTLPFMYSTPSTTGIRAMRITSAGELVVATQPALGPAVISLVDRRNGTLVSSVAGRMMQPGGMAVMHDGTVLVSDTAMNAVFRVAFDGTITKLVQDIPSPTGLAVTPDGSQLFIGSNGAATAGVFSIALDSTGQPVGQPLLYAQGVRIDGGIAFDQCGNLYAGSIARSSIVRISWGGARTDAIADVPAGTQFLPRGVAFGAGTGFDDTTLYIVDESGAVYTLMVGVHGSPLP
jgi:sugar lactone lactonase YvrE